MAKRRRKENNKFSWSNIFTAISANRTLLLRFFWGFTIFICLLFGYLQGYPLVAAGQVWDGILTGVIYGVGAFIAISVSFYLNRKLRGY